MKICSTEIRLRHSFPFSKHSTKPQSSQSIPLRKTRWPSLCGNRRPGRSREEKMATHCSPTQKNRRSQPKRRMHPATSPLLPRSPHNRSHTHRCLREYLSGAICTQNTLLETVPFCKICTDFKRAASSPGRSSHAQVRAAIVPVSETIYWAVTKWTSPIALIRPLSSRMHR
jgi:hypothetical protein